MAMALLWQRCHQAALRWTPETAEDSRTRPPHPLVAKPHFNAPCKTSHRNGLGALTEGRLICEHVLCLRRLCPADTTERG